MFFFIKENGQRKYGGPPPDWNGPPPERGCEIFIGKLPRDLFEDELIPLCEKVIIQFSRFSFPWGIVKGMKLLARLIPKTSKVK